MNTITINNTELTVKEANNQRLVTFKDIDAVHGKSDGQAKLAFTRNKKHFIEGEDYLRIPENTEKYQIDTFGKIPPRGIICLTESGYLMIVKTFTDDLAWEVQRKLVNNYFKAKKMASDNELLLKEISAMIDSKLAQRNQTPILAAPNHKSWKAKTFDKIKKIVDVMNENGRTVNLGRTLHLLINRMEDFYNIDFQDYDYEYRATYSIPESEQIYELDIIAASRDLKLKFTDIINTVSNSLGIENAHEPDIFDQLAKEIA